MNCCQERRKIDIVCSVLQPYSKKRTWNSTSALASGPRRLLKSGRAVFRSSLVSSRQRSSAMASCSRQGRQRLCKGRGSLDIH